MRKQAYLLLFILTIIISCQSGDEPFEVGLDLVESKSEISMVDSFSVKLSTVRMDSLPTSGTEVALVGRFYDALTGSMEANSYFNFDLAENLTGIEDEAIFDSATIRFYYSDYFIGDSLQAFPLEVYRLTSQLKLRETDISETYLFNTSFFPQEEEPMGALNFYPQTSHDFIEIRLNDDFGEEIMQMAKDETDELANDENFLAYLKGFALKPGVNAPLSMIGFEADSISLKLYTHILNYYEPVEITFDFAIASDDTHYNQIVVDREGTAFDTIGTQREELPASEAGNISFIQGSAGILTRVDFPSLNEIYKLEDRVLLKAELILIPAVESFQHDVPATIDFYETDKINQLGDQLTVETDDSEASVQGTLVEDKLYPENSYYSVDITSFISSELSGNYYDTNNGLLVTVPMTDFLSKADHLILNGESAQEYQSKLNLYFLTYE